MAACKKLGILFLHALPLDGSMWAAQNGLLPNATYALTLYALGDSIEAWAASTLAIAEEERLLVVGCSVGGSCALEIAAIAPGRVAALVLIGTKARHRPDPALHAHALEIIENQGLEAAWQAFWAPLFSKATGAAVVNDAKQILLRQSIKDVAGGVTAFHTRPSRDEALARFPGLITVISGSDDTAPGPGTSASQARTARNGRFMAVPDCGHYVPLEQPDYLNAVLRDIMAELRL